MSQETRTVRPFVGLSNLPEFFASSVLHFGPDSCQEGSSVFVDVAANEFLLRPVRLELAPDDEAFEALLARLEVASDRARIPLEELILVVVARTPFLRTASLIYECRGDSLLRLPRLLNLTGTDRPREFQAPYSGFNLDTYLALAEHKAPEPLRPYKKGTWIGRGRFAVETSLAPAVMPPSPLTAEERLRLGLPPRTMRYIDFGAHDPLMPHREQEQPTFWVDDSILGHLNARRTTAVSRAIQVQLAHDFVSAVVWRASESADLEGLTFDDIRTSLLGSIVRVASGVGASDSRRNAVLQQVKENPWKVIAAAEHAVDLLAPFNEALKDGEQ